MFSRSILNAVSLIIAGLCLGWFIGLSVSPVVGTVVSTILTAIVAAIAALNGTDSDSTSGAGQTSTSMSNYINKLNIYPITFLLVGAVIGSATGIYTRTHNLLSPSSEVAVQKRFKEIKNEILFWEKEGINRSEIIAALFQRNAEGAGNCSNQPLLAGTEPDPVPTTTSVLFNALSEDDCNHLRRIKGEELRRELRMNTDEKVRLFAKEVDDINALILYTEIFLCPVEK